MHMKDAQTWLEQKHGVPLREIKGHVYVICHQPAQHLLNVSSDYPSTPDRTPQQKGKLRTSVPIRHYVGWTQQKTPFVRVSQHYTGTGVVPINRPSGTEGRLMRGPDQVGQYQISAKGLTMQDEEAAKQFGECPFCGERFSESLRANMTTS